MSQSHFFFLGGDGYIHDELHVSDGDGRLKRVLGVEPQGKDGNRTDNQDDNKFFHLSGTGGSNSRPHGPKPCALPTELVPVVNNPINKLSNNPIIQ